MFIKTLQTLGLAFFNSITKNLTILYFGSFSASFYLLFFSYMWYNFKWSQNFQTCSQLALKNESKEVPPFCTFFNTNVTLWSAVAWFFAGSEKGFLLLQTLIPCNLYGKIFWIFFHIFSNQLLQDPMVACVQNYFILKFGTCPVPEMAVLERFCW